MLRLGAGYSELLFARPAERMFSGPKIAVGPGAVDLMARRFEMDAFFGETWIGRVVYPPASYAMLWPLVGWNGVQAARWTWALVSTVALAWLCFACARDCGFPDPLARAAMGLVPPATLAASAAFSVGQVTVVAVALLVAGTLRLARTPTTARDDAATGILYALAAVKPTLAAPFGWLLLFLPRTRRPLLVAAAVYGMLTLLAVGGRIVSLPSGIGWDTLVIQVRSLLGGPFPGVERARHPATGAGAPSGSDRSSAPQSTPAPESIARAEAWSRTAFEGGTANLQNLLMDIGAPRSTILLAPFIATLMFGPWAWRHRHADPWLQLGLAGLFARLAFYHRVYDDLLVIPAFVALARIASGAVESPSGGRVPVAAGTARMALAILLVSAGTLCVPRDFPPPRILILPKVAEWMVAFVLISRVARAPSRA